MYGFDASEVALELGARLKPVIDDIRRYDADLADQIYRAAKSLVLNAAEEVGEAVRIADTTSESRPGAPLSSRPACGSRSPGSSAALSRNCSP